MQRKLTLLLAAALLSGLALAQPSTYYLWKHKTTGKVVCEPDAPDATHWVKAGGPFEDHECKIKQAQ